MYKSCGDEYARAEVPGHEEEVMWNGKTRKAANDDRKRACCIEFSASALCR